MSSKKSNLRGMQFILLIMSSVMGLLLAEAGVRLARPQSLSVWSMTRERFVIHRPNLRDVETAHGKRFDTNSIGMRDGEHAIQKDPKTYRIVILGDSFMEATQVEWADSLPALLEANLSDALHQPVEVINLAVSGWGTDVQLGYLERYGLAYRPDLVLLAMTPHNDISDNFSLLYHRPGADGRTLTAVDDAEIRMNLLPFVSHKVREWLAGQF